MGFYDVTNTYGCFSLDYSVQTNFRSYPSVTGHYNHFFIAAIAWKKNL